MKRFIVMICGYAENSSTAPLIYQSGFFGKIGYEHTKEAITDLTLDLQAKFMEFNSKAFDAEEFMEYVINLTSTTCDSYGDAEYAAGRHLKWWPYWIGDFIGAPKEDVIFIAENAELVLLEALAEAMPQLDCDIDNKSSTEWETFKKDIQPSYR